MVPARCTLVTLGVSDVARSKAFYRALGWEAGIDMDDFVVFRTAGPLLALYPIEDMSRDAGDEVPTDRTRRIHLAINLESPQEVDEAVAEFLAAGAGLLRSPEAAEWGGYTSIVADPDGHAWEIAHNPGWPLGEDGLAQLP
jgi:catechol 2,3-dioxygenase-like lactoylglutathione lyase family enzyme